MNRKPVSRRQFVGAAVLVAGAAFSPVALASLDNHRQPRTRTDAHGGLPACWYVARNIIASGAVGKVLFASALLPRHDDDAALTVQRTFNGAVIPEAAASVLDGFMYALGVSRAEWIHAVESEMTKTFTLKCTLGDAARIAIASVAPDSEFAATIHGRDGVLHLSESAITVNSRGQWRTINAA